MPKQSLSEKLLEFRARAAEGFLNEHKSLQGFSEHWKRNEDGFLVAAKQELEAENAKAGDAERTAAIMSQRRSEMTPAQKAAFVSEHGCDAFQALAE